MRQHLNAVVAHVSTSQVDAGVKVPMITISEERDGVLSILASSSKPEGTSVSSSGLDMSVRSKSGSACGNVRDRALIRGPARSLHRGGRGGRSLGGARAARDARPFGGRRRVSNAQAARSTLVVFALLR